MPFYEREDEILRLLNDGEASTNEELAKKLFISKQTLRRDLEKLEKKGLIIRTHGGAMPIKHPADRHIPFFLREHEQSDAKNIIAKKALEFIHEGDTIMLDGATSAYAIVPYLTSFSDLTVITSSAKACFLLGNMNIKTICTGGHMLSKSLSYVGDDAIRTIENYNADAAFFSCRGLTEDGLLSDPSIEENLVRRAMMAQSEKKIFLCDSSKIGQKYLHNLCNISDIDEVICEIPLPPISGMK
ncbi:MAG: DeoR/GlpR transcriptional regulator [Clostridia bacterium]|nr:DeoR/GlpR transcriptional regulator [Clostridia bacterium]